MWCLSCYKKILEAKTSGLHQTGSGGFCMWGASCTWSDQTFTSVFSKQLVRHQVAPLFFLVRGDVHKHRPLEQTRCRGFFSALAVSWGRAAVAIFLVRVWCLLAFPILFSIHVVVVFLPGICLGRRCCWPWLWTLLVSEVQSGRCKIERMLFSKVHLFCAQTS